MVGAVGLIVVDPQRGFTDRQGSYGKTHGFDELRPIDETARRLGVFAARHDGPSIWVRSLYQPGQCAPPGHPLANLCTSLNGLDCAWDPRLTPPAHAVIVTKHHPDALSSSEFVTAFDDLVSNADTVIISGFTLPTCVANRTERVPIRRAKRGGAGITDAPFGMIAKRN